MAFVASPNPRRDTPHRRIRPTVRPNIPKPVITYNPEYGVVRNMIVAIDAVMGWGWKLSLRQSKGSNSAAND